MNMQQMVQALQKTQREYAKKQKELEASSFEYTANGAIKVTVTGDRKITSIEFLDEEILDKENKEMVADLLTLAINNCFEQIDTKEEEIAEQFKRAPGGNLF